MSETDELKARIAELEAENAALRKALEWYASPKTWNQWCPESFAERAREALTALPTDQTLEQSSPDGERAGKEGAD